VGRKIGRREERGRWEEGMKKGVHGKRSTVVKFGVGPYTAP